MHDSRGSLLLLPTTDGDKAARVLEHSDRVTIVTPVPGPAGALATRTCAALLQITVLEPLRIVAVADGAELLPAVARALHARSVQVVDYVLVDPSIPPVSDTWPDAPVTVFCHSGSETARMAGLRGWTVRDLSDLSTFDD